MLALHQAVAENSIQQVQKLIDEGANVNESGFEIFPHGKCTPLQVAACKGFEDIAELLISNGAMLETKNQRGETALSVAAYEKKNSFVKFLLRKGAHPYIYWAICANNTECVQTLLSNGADANELDDFHDTPLHLAIQKGNCEIIQLLLDYNADINAFQTWKSPLHVAIIQNDRKATKILLKNGANPNLTSNPHDLRFIPLHIGISIQHFDIVELLIAYNADLNSKDQIGNSPMHKAFLYNDTQLSKILLKNGACINVKDRNDDNTIEKALRLKEIDFAKHILYNV